MDYIKTNKDAWEETFQKHKEGYKFDIADKLLEKNFFFLGKEVLADLQNMELSGKHGAQFCCNNGRELLSIMKLGLQSGTGFDIADNFVKEGNRIAKAADLNCKFIPANIYDIGEEYYNTFDFLLISIGALCWFENIDLFFKKVSLVLKDNGTLYINEIHPFCDMLASDQEDEYDPDKPANIVFPYFREEPWIENEGMDYVGGTVYKSKTFTSFTHTMSAIINAIIHNQIVISTLNEYDYDVSGMFSHLDNQKLPLSFTLSGKKIPI